MSEPAKSLWDPAVPPTNPNGAPLMIKRGGTNYDLHAVGLLNGAGARASICGLVGSFYDAPEGLKYVRCVKCFPPANEQEIAGRRRAR